MTKHNKKISDNSNDTSNSSSNDKSESSNKSNSESSDKSNSESSDKSEFTLTDDWDKKIDGLIELPHTEINISDIFTSKIPKKISKKNKPVTSLEKKISYKRYCAIFKLPNNNIEEYGNYYTTSPKEITTKIFASIINIYKHKNIPLTSIEFGIKEIITEKYFWFVGEKINGLSNTIKNASEDDCEDLINFIKIA